MLVHPSRVIVYQPLHVRLALAVYGGLLLTVGQVSDLLTGAWFAWPPRAPLHVLGVFLFVLQPLHFLLFGGWSYELTASQLIARRFGRERERLALADLTAIETVMGLHKLRFKQTTLWIAARPLAEQKTFLAELEHRARDFGMTAPAPVRQVGPDAIRLRVESVRFPPVCVRCERAPAFKRPLVAKRGLDLLFIMFFQHVELKAPVCAEHQQMRSRARWLSWLVFFPLALLIAIIMKLTMHAADWTGVVILALVATAGITRPIYSLGVGQWLDWWILGVRTSGLSADLGQITLRVRSGTVLAAIRRNAGDPNV